MTKTLIDRSLAKCYRNNIMHKLYTLINIWLVVTGGASVTLLQKNNHETRTQSYSTVPSISKLFIQIYFYIYFTLGRLRVTALHAVRFTFSSESMFLVLLVFAPSFFLQHTAPQWQSWSSPNWTSLLYFLSITSTHIDIKNDPRKCSYW